MSTVQAQVNGWPPKLTLAGVAISVDRLTGENNTIWLFNAAGDRIAEICDGATACRANRKVSMNMIDIREERAARKSDHEDDDRVFDPAPLVAQRFALPLSIA